MSGSNPDQLWNLIPNGPTPLTGQEQLLAAQTAAPNAPMYRYPANAFTDAAVVVASSVIATGTTISRTLQNRFADRYSVLDSLTVGQPDGTTNNSADIQAAINAAAGVAQLLFPATANPYIIGTTLSVPSDSHIIVEVGATIKAGAGIASTTGRNSIFCLVNYATSVLIDLFGTLDGNGPNQPTISGVTYGAIDVAVPAGTRGGVISHCAVRGGGTGLITNVYNWAINFSAATDCPIEGLSMTNTAQHAGSPTVGGFRNLTNNLPAATIDSGTYVGATGICTLITQAPHGIVPGEEFGTCGLAGVINLTGTGGFANAEGCALIAGPGTSGSTIVYQGPIGGADGTISFTGPATNAGWITNWSRPTAVIASGSYTSATGVVTLTTTAPHLLTYGQNITVNATGGSAASAATGVFTLQAGSTGTTLVYVAPTGMGDGTITSGAVAISLKSYNSGFSNCYIEKVADFGVVIYGGGIDCYIRNCEVTGGQSSGPAIFSDANFGRNIGCEISGCYAHDNLSTGITVDASVNTSVVKHLNTRIFSNYITRNKTAVGLSQADGVDFSNNTLFANFVNPASVSGLTGDINIGNFSTGVKITKNTILNPCQTTNALVQITSGTYNNTTGAVSLTTATAHNMITNAMVVVSGLTGTGAFASLNGAWLALAGTGGTTINYNTAAGLGATAITGGQVVPGGFGIMVNTPEECLIGDNFIGDYQATPSMLAAIGGTWSTSGLSRGNYYGPRINTVGNFPADMSQYAGGSVQGVSYDVVTTAVSGFSQPLGVSPSSSSPPPRGLTMAWNYGAGRGDVDFLLGAGSGGPGGFNLIQVLQINVAGSYDSGTAIVSLTTGVAHGLVVGNVFTLIDAFGTDSIGPTGLRDVKKLNGSWIVTSAGSATTLTFVLTTNTGGMAVPLTGLDILSITAGAINSSATGGGVINTAVGVAGSLLAGDGVGNTRLGGALMHGALGNVLNQPALTNGGTVTIQPNTSFVAVRNSASIATATIVFPTPSGGESWQTPITGVTNNELEINFENPIGTLTWTLPSPFTASSTPSSITTAGTSINFIQVGTAWLRRIMS